MSSSSPVESLPLPPPVIRYFDLLPPELVQLVLRFASRPPGDASTAYRTRLDTLRSLCLTSKRLHSFALPLLLEYIHLDPYHELKTLERLGKQDTKKNLGLLRRLNLGTLNTISSSTAQRIEGIFLAAPLLQEVSLHRVGRVLPSLPGRNITTLSLQLLPSLGSRFDFPVVQYLNIQRCRFEGVGGAPVEWYLPSLKHLAFSPHSIIPSDEEARFLLHVMPTLTSARLAVPLTPGSYPSAIVSSPMISCFYTTTIYYPPQVLTENHSLTHLCLNIQYESLERGKSVMNGWTETIGQGQHQLQWLSFLCPPGSMELVNHLQVVDRSLLNACERRNVTVIWEDLSPGSEFWDVVSPTLIKMSEERHRSE